MVPKWLSGEDMASLWGCSIRLGDVAVKRGLFTRCELCRSGRDNVLFFRSVLVSLLRCVPPDHMGRSLLYCLSFSTANLMSRLCWYHTSNTLRTYPNRHSMIVGTSSSLSLVSPMVESGVHSWWYLGLDMKCSLKDSCVDVLIST